MRPIIGITANFRNDGEMEYSRSLGFADQKWHSLADDYIQTVLRAGGIPVILPVLSGAAVREDGAAQTKWMHMLQGLDGIIFSGGSDVDPQRYGERSTGLTGTVVPERDRQELFLARRVWEQTDLPVLGICRGLQVINAALGGTLMEDVQASGHPSHTLWMYPRTERSHTVTVAAGSRLGQILLREEWKPEDPAAVTPPSAGSPEPVLGVNSLHHMAVRTLAPSLKAAAVSGDGLIEAVEPLRPSARFLLAVQWHPEMMSSASALQQSIVNAFVQSCGR